MKRSLLLAAVTGVVALLVSGQAAARTPASLDLNRHATTYSASKLADDKFDHAHTGFRWNSSDDHTLAWRPQGITGYIEDERNFLFVSWHGQKAEDAEGLEYPRPYTPTKYDGQPCSTEVKEYADLGVRVSVVDVSDMSDVNYRHVLLTDEEGCPIPDLHAGGIHYDGEAGVLYVAHSKGSIDSVLMFPIDAIISVEDPDNPGQSSKTHNYLYEWPHSGSYGPLQVNPSFLSFDRSTGLFLTGVFEKEGDGNHRSVIFSDNEGYSSESKLLWFSPYTGEWYRHSGFYTELQGAASDAGVLWTTSSNGRSHNSHLHLDCFTPTDLSSQTISGDRIVYPPGLEDMHVSAGSDNIWMLTEFGPDEKNSTIGSKTNHRVVFAVDRDKIMPAGGCPFVYEGETYIKYRETTGMFDDFGPDSTWVARDGSFTVSNEAKHGSVSIGLAPPYTKVESPVLYLGGVHLSKLFVDVYLEPIGDGSSSEPYSFGEFWVECSTFPNGPYYAQVDQEMIRLLEPGRWHRLELDIPSSVADDIASSDQTLLYFVANAAGTVLVDNLRLAK